MHAQVPPPYLAVDHPRHHGAHRRHGRHRDRGRGGHHHQPAAGRTRHPGRRPHRAGEPDENNLGDPQLRLRVRADGTRNGAGDGSVTRAIGSPKGVYDVTFSSSILNGGTGESGDTLVNENCAVTATARSAAAPPATAVDVLPVVFLLRTTGPNTVRVSTIDPTRAQGDRLVDTAFDITANC